ncbi:peroxisomal membrane protein-domain-containing protein [Limtongia smithiae]|uniref:peroxisomal membrane protein-domain-containing protein n=1 Tax=Limtongia smithiae TaxID=1125753 RepID=UPI0034CE0634
MVLSEERASSGVRVPTQECDQDGTESTSSSTSNGPYNDEKNSVTSTETPTDNGSYCIPLENGSKAPCLSTDEKAPSSNWLSSYETFLLRNASQIASVESTLQHLTYVFPGRFKDVEVATEAISTALGILGLYHDTILQRALNSSRGFTAGFRPSRHSRYTQYLTIHSVAYKRAAYFLSILQRVELLLETLLRKRTGVRGQKLAILSIESAKAACRLYLLKLTGNRMLPTEVIPGREIDPNLLNPDDPAFIAREEVDQANHWMMPRTGQRLAQLPAANSDAVAQFLMKKVLQPDDIVSGPRLLHQLSSDGTMKEILYILRPLTYAILTMASQQLKESPRLSSSRRMRQAIEWMPWVIGFAFEYGCRDGIIDTLSAGEHGLSGASARLTGLEKSELKNRSDALWWWLVRGKFYESFTKPIIDGVIKRTEHIPVINLLSLYVADYQYLIETYHFASKFLLFQVLFRRLQLTCVQPRLCDSGACRTM